MIVPSEERHLCMLIYIEHMQRGNLCICILKKPHSFILFVLQFKTCNVFIVGFSLSDGSGDRRIGRKSDVKSASGRTGVG